MAHNRWAVIAPIAMAATLTIAACGDGGDDDLCGANGLAQRIDHFDRLDEDERRAVIDELNEIEASGTTADVLRRAARALDHLVGEDFDHPQTQAAYLAIEADLTTIKERIADQCSE